MRKTSLLAYQEIRDKNLLSRLQFLVFEVIQHHGPISQGEAWQRFFPARQRHTIAPRFAELEKLGVISAISERPCQLTGKTVMVYVATGKLPSKPEQPRQPCLICRGKGYLDN